MVPPKSRKEFHRQCHQVIRVDVGMYEAQQEMIDSDPEGATPEKVGPRVIISFDQGLNQARRIIDMLLKQEAAAKTLCRADTAEKRNRNLATR